MLGWNFNFDTTYLGHNSPLQVNPWVNPSNLSIRKASEASRIKNLKKVQIFNLINVLAKFTEIGREASNIKVQN